MKCQKDLHTVRSEREWWDEFSSYPDRFFDLLSSNPMMLRDFIEHKERFFIKKVHPVFLKDNNIGMSLRDRYQASFIMINEKVLKNRWGAPDRL